MLIALLNKERSLFAFFSTFMTFFTLGGGAWLATKHAGIQLRTRDGFVIIVLSVLSGSAQFYWRSGCYCPRRSGIAAAGYWWHEAVSV